LSVTLLELAEPDAYDPSFKQWRLEHLPIVPQEWQLKAKASSRKQLAVLRKLVKEADQLIHAGHSASVGINFFCEVFYVTSGENSMRHLPVTIADISAKLLTKIKLHCFTPKGYDIVVYIYAYSSRFVVI
jgi:hypothetical protein